MTENKTMSNEIPIIEDESFSYEGFQVVRGEFFSHIFEPSFTFSCNKVYVNSACLRRLPEITHVQILVNAEQKKLAVRPCDENAKDALKWQAGGEKRSPRQIPCRIFFAKVFSLMGWNHNYRYKLLGKLIRSNGDLLFIFDLSSPEIYVSTVKDDGTEKKSRMPQYPAEWQTQFGIPAVEHQSSLQINLFNGYAIFGISQTKEGGKENVNADDLS